MNLLDDTPVVPGDVRQPFAHGNDARTILNDAETELQSWRANLEPIHTNAGGLGSNAMPTEQAEQETAASPTAAVHHSSAVQDAGNPVQGEGTHLEKAVAA